MIFLKIAVDLICGALFSWGGFNFLSARRDIMPPIIAVMCGLVTHSWWCIAMLLSIAVYHLGYGDKSKFRHIFGAAWGRGVWGLLAAICLSLPLFLTHHLAWYFVVPYLVLNFFCEPLFKNLQQILGDIIIGIAFGSIVFLIH